MQNALCFPAVDEDFWITPRMRGEDGTVLAYHVIQSGSPPHARGRHAALPRSTGTPRITPACAGKTDSLNDTPAFNEDHPRMRGEDAAVLLGQQRIG